MQTGGKVVILRMQGTDCNIESCFLCQSCMPAWRAAIAANKQTLAFRKGEVIFREGDKVQGIFFLYEGAVKVHQSWEEQKELILRFATAGDVIGLRGIGDTYPVTATALDDTKLCFIDNVFYEASLQTNPSLTYKMMQRYALELQQAELRMRNLAHMEVKGRIASALLDLKQVFGLDKEKYIALAVTRQDIASYAGAAYETVFKFFVELTNENIIATSGKHIKIVNETALKNYVKQPRKAA